MIEPRLCGTCDPETDQCVDSEGGGAKPTSVTIQWIGAGDPPGMIYVKFQNRPRGCNIKANATGDDSDIYFVNKTDACFGNNLFIYNDTNDLANREDLK